MTDFITRYRFSILHRIVMRLLPMDLEQQLQVTTSDINAQCLIGQTALTLAVWAGDLEKVRILLEYRADIAISDKFGSTALHYAANSFHDNSCQIITALMQACPNSSEIGLSRAALCPTMFFLNANDPSNAAKSLVKYNTATGGINTPLLLAIWNLRTANAKVLIENNVDINATSANGTTPLLMSIQTNNHEILELLLDLGVDVHLMDRKGQGVLHYGALFADLRSLEIIARANLMGLDIEHRDIDDYTPIEAFELVRPRLATEDSATMSKCRKFLEEILRNASSHDINQESLHGKGQVDDLDLFYESDLESEDDFFDARSSFEEIISGKES